MPNTPIDRNLRRSLFAFAAGTGLVAWCAAAGFSCRKTAKNRGRAGAPETLKSGFYDLAAGGRHTCGIRYDRTVWCWGAGGVGQLGDGAKESTHRPVRAGKLAGIVAVAAGRVHSCALDRDGKAWCWGGNEHGQLGAATQPAFSTAPRPVPVKARLVALAAGDFHTCGLTAASAVWCWGDNAAGQLGRSGMGKDPGSPAPVPSLADVRGVSAGGAHTCAVRTDGTVFCFGLNDAGQLRDGSFVNRARPVRAELPEKTVSVAAGALHTCALDPEGGVWCWGSTDEGRLGVAAAPGKAHPFGGPVRVPGLRETKALAAGDHHTCVVEKNGAVRCWGYGGDGQLAQTLVETADPVPVRGAARAARVSCGAGHACVLGADHQVTCWGRNDSGQAGHPSLDPSPLTPLPAVLERRPPVPAVAPSRAAGVPPRPAIPARETDRCTAAGLKCDRFRAVEFNRTWDLSEAAHRALKGAQYERCVCLALRTVDRATGSVLPAAHYNASACFEKLGCATEAKRHILQAVERSPRKGAVFKARCRTYLRLHGRAHRLCDEGRAR